MEETHDNAIQHVCQKGVHILTAFFWLSLLSVFSEGNVIRLASLSVFKQLGGNILLTIWLQVNLKSPYVV